VRVEPVLTRAQRSRLRVCPAQGTRRARGCRAFCKSTRRHARGAREGRGRAARGSLRRYRGRRAPAIRDVVRHVRRRPDEAHVPQRWLRGPRSRSTPRATRLRGSVRNRARRGTLCGRPRRHGPHERPVGGLGRALSVGNGALSEIGLVLGCTGVPWSMHFPTRGYLPLQCDCRECSGLGYQYTKQISNPTVLCPDVCSQFHNQAQVCAQPLQAIDSWRTRR
jgi:hypothetical protein